MRYPVVCCLCRCIRSSWRTACGSSWLELWLRRELFFGTSIFRFLDWEINAHDWQIRISETDDWNVQGLPIQISRGLRHVLRHVKQNLYFSISFHLCSGLMDKKSLQSAISWLCLFTGQGNLRPGWYQGFCTEGRGGDANVESALWQGFNEVRRFSLGKLSKIFVWA